jgi:hypothetical protein
MTKGGRFHISARRRWPAQSGLVFHQRLGYGHADPAIRLHDAPTSHTLREVFVGCADDHPFDTPMPSYRLCSRGHKNESAPDSI